MFVNRDTNKLTGLYAKNDIKTQVLQNTEVSIKIKRPKSYNTEVSVLIKGPKSYNTEFSIIISNLVL